MQNISNEDVELAKFIVSFLTTRNRGELQEPIENMRVLDYKCMHAELALILHYRGKPPNWT